MSVLDNKLVKSFALAGAVAVAPTLPGCVTFNTKGAPIADGGCQVGVIAAPTRCKDTLQDTEESVVRNFPNPQGKTLNDQDASVQVVKTTRTHQVLTRGPSVVGEVTTMIGTGGYAYGAVVTGQANARAARAAEKTADAQSEYVQMLDRNGGVATRVNYSNTETQTIEGDTTTQTANPTTSVAQTANPTVTTTQTANPTLSSSSTATASPTLTSSPTLTATASPTLTATASPTVTATASPTTTLNNVNAAGAVAGSTSSSSSAASAGASATVPVTTTCTTPSCYGLE